MADIPKCRNRACSNSLTVLDSETETNWVFYCKSCGGIEVRSKPAAWKAGAQERGYQQYGRPEYARKKATFDMGHNNVTAGRVKGR